MTTPLSSSGVRTTAICVPLPGMRIPLGTLVIGWDTAHDIDVIERAVVTALPGSVSRVGAGEDSSAPATVAVSIGDVTGHDIEAATLMGQWRSILRQADLDHPGAGPARIVSALDHANRALGIAVSGTLVHAHLRPAGAGADS